MTHEELAKLLADAGFDSGWVLQGDQLLFWDNDENPPAPLIKPVAEKPAKTAK